MFSLFSAFVNQKELKVMKLENYYVCFLIYTSECFWDKLLQCSAFLAPINLNSPVALRLKYPYHDIKPWKIISARHGIFFFGKYSNLQERIRITGVHDPIWIVCPRSWNTYQPCNLLPSLGFAFKIRYPNLLPPPPSLGTKLNKIDVTSFVYSW